MIDEAIQKKIYASYSNPAIEAMEQLSMDEKRKKLREKIELRAMAKELLLDDKDWDAAFGDYPAN
jgi:hypothetical protein